MKGLLLLVIVIALIVIGPLLVIWSANTLFPALNIDYTFWTWLSVLIIGGFLRSEVKVSR